MKFEFVCTSLLRIESGFTCFWQACWRWWPGLKSFILAHNFLRFTLLLNQGFLSLSLLSALPVSSRQWFFFRKGRENKQTKQTYVQTSWLPVKPWLSLSVTSRLWGSRRCHSRSHLTRIIVLFCLLSMASTKTLDRPGMAWYGGVAQELDLLMCTWLSCKKAGPGWEDFGQQAMLNVLVAKFRLCWVF